MVHHVTGAGVWLHDAIATEQGFAAVGYEFDPEEPSEPGDFNRGTILTSRDGIDWTHVAPEVLDGAVLRKVVEYEGDLYAFGSHCPPDQDCEAGPQRASWAIWKSVDWSTWKQLPRSPALQSQVIADVVIAGGEMVALGAQMPDDAEGIPWAAVTWRSTDGVTWKPSQPFDIEDLPGFFRAASNGSTIVATQGATYLSASAWYSTDLGRSWTNVALTDADGCQIVDVAVVGDRFVLVGQTAWPINTPYPCSWTSFDGISWTGGWVGGHEGMTLSGVVGVGDLAVAVGEIPDDDPWTGGPAVVLVGDGVEWRRIETLGVYNGGLTPLFLAGNDAGAVALGIEIIDPADPSFQWEIWRLPPEVLAAGSSSR